MSRNSLKCSAKHHPAWGWALSTVGGRRFPPHIDEEVEKRGKGVVGPIYAFFFLPNNPRFFFLPPSFFKLSAE